MKIRIVKPISGTEKLKLTYRPATANPNGVCRSVTWITATEDVQDFMIDSKYPDREYPFETPTPTDFRPELTLLLKTRESALDWEYNIHWRDKSGKIKIFDPKIPIKPKGKPTDDVVTFSLGAFLFHLLNLPFIKKLKSK